MLVRLFGRNFRSLQGEFELSLVAANLTREEDCDRGVIKLPISGTSEPLRLLRVVGIFGANASGKSTVLTAGDALRWLVTESSVQSKPDAAILPYDPFLLDDESRSAPIELGCDVVHNKSLLRYEITFGAKMIQRETLTILGGKRNRKLIDRQRSGEVGGELITCSDANRLYVKEMQPNVTVLSKLAQHGPHKGKESVQPYYKAIQDATRYADYSAAASVFGASENERFADDAGYREWIMRHLIRTADVGICDVHARRESVDFPDVLKQLAKIESALKIPEELVVVSFVHEGRSSKPIDFRVESAGTKKLFNIASDWWLLASESITLLADELGASIHPRLLDSLIRAVNDALPSRARSQLIFTTHETGLLESQDGKPPALRRDQVYFTRKDANGASELYSLAEFKDDARPVHNIRRRYLSGLYGAIPAAEKISL
jgi:uncharacterized protein